MKASGSGWSRAPDPDPRPRRPAAPGRKSRLPKMAEERFRSGADPSGVLRAHLSRRRPRTAARPPALGRPRLRPRLGPHDPVGLEVLGRLPLARDETVLDVGCGTGRVTELLLERLAGGRVVALRRRRRHARRGPAPPGPLRRPGHVPRSRPPGPRPRDLAGWAPVDAVLSTATFHWVLDHDRLFRRPLPAAWRPGRRLVAQCGAAGNIARLIEAVRATGTDRAGAWLYATPEDTRPLARGGGLHRHRGLDPPRADPDRAGPTSRPISRPSCLRTHVPRLAPDERAAFIAAVAAAMATGHRLRPAEHRGPPALISAPARRPRALPSRVPVGAPPQEVPTLSGR